MRNVDVSVLLLTVIFMLVAGAAPLNAQSAGYLVEAAWEGDLAAVQQLVDNGVDANASMEGATALAAASYHGHVSIVEFLLQHGAAPNTTVPELSRTALHIAAMKGHSEALRLLLAANADTEVRDKEGVTPLGLAVTSGDQAVVEDLVRHGADLSATFPPSDATALHGAATWGNGPMALVMLKHGARHDARSSTGKTPLHYAAAAGKREVALHLIRAGATVEAVDDDDRRPLHNAAATGHDDLVALLIEQGADVDVADEKGMTPLHWAAARGRDKRFWGTLGVKGASLGHQHRNIVKRLIEAGADVNARDKKKRTPLRIAVKGKHADLVAIFEKHGAE